MIFRRFFAFLIAFIIALATPALARTVTDSAGRSVEIPDHVTRVFAAGPPASVLLYMLAPEKMTGWVRAPRETDKPFLLPSVHDLPEHGRLTGRGDTLNLERLMADKPDVIIDFGTVSETYRSLADRVQAQTGIPYLLIDGRFNNTPAAIRLLADMIDVGERGEQLASAAETIFASVDRVLSSIPEENRPRVYLARGTDGLESGSRGSINTEIIERVGAINVVDGLREKGGIVNVSPEQIIAWAPETIIALEPAFAGSVGANPIWQPVPAVSSGRIFPAPGNPFGFVDFPPSVNRLIGLTWLLHQLYPQEVSGDLRDEVRDFYRLFYQADLSDADLDNLLGVSRD
ncbi:iron ABC transporter substrate-binding protein [Aquamicrobium segne]|uniref:Iron ABC transporter substrate-binding protein n=1 Tax=Aquamicrobium segne TaxID=469547 RepID=A0ABW0H2G1_9HYPH